MVDYDEISRIAHSRVSMYPDMIRRGRISPDFIFDSLGYDVVPIPGLRDFAATLEINADTLLLCASKCVYFDSSLLYTTRYNFSVAHELGHLELHADRYAHCSTMEEFLLEYLEYGVPEILEKEANAYAASLLMPEQLIVPAVEQLVDTLTPTIKNIMKQRNLDDNISTISPRVAAPFGVSDQAAYWRIFNHPTLRQLLAELSKE